MVTPLKLAALYLVFLMPSGWSVLADLELVLNMGRDTGMYPDYGRTTVEAIWAYSFLCVSVIWLTFGTVLTLQIARRKLGTGCLWSTLPIAFLIICPANLIYLAGLGHF
jgi:hypothetical protein